MFNQPAADNWTDSGRDSAESRPGADRSAAIGIVKRCTDDGEAAWDEEGGADPLQRAPNDEETCGRREATQDRRGRKRRDAEEEDALAAELVAHRAPDQNQRTQKQRVGLDHPLDVRDRRPKAVLKCWQRDVDHCRVGERHARADDGRGQSPAGS